MWKEIQLGYLFGSGGLSDGCLGISLRIQSVNYLIDNCCCFRFVEVERFGSDFGLAAFDGLLCRIKVFLTVGPGFIGVLLFMPVAEDAVGKDDGSGERA